MSDFEWLDEYLLQKPGATKDYKPEWGWYRFMVGGKLFAALCRPDEKHAVYGGHPLITLKCDPMLSELLRKENPGILPGFYMDKRNWISILLDQTTDRELIFNLCDASWKLVYEGLSKKLQREISPSDAKP